jgi:hypothetical protein
MLPHFAGANNVRAMSQRTRKLVGTLVLIVFLVIYALIMMALGAPRIAEASNLARVVFYFVAGLIWVLPAGLLIKWMQRPD